MGRFERAELVVQPARVNLVDETYTPNFKQKRYRDGKQAVKAIKTYLHGNYAGAFTLDELAELTGYNKHYLRTLFKKSFGLSPHAYQHQVRLEYAKQFLEQGNSAAEVASQVGFSDQSHLNRYFQRHFGMTAGEYQRLNATPD